jgi:hypothetical protein
MARGSYDIEPFILVWMCWRVRVIVLCWLITGVSVL